MAAHFSERIPRVLSIANAGMAAVHERDEAAGRQSSTSRMMSLKRDLRREVCIYLSLSSWLSSACFVENWVHNVCFCKEASNTAPSEVY